MEDRRMLDATLARDPIFSTRVVSTEEIF